MAREIVLIYIAAIAFLLAAPARASVTISQADLSCREGTFAGTHTGVGMYVQVWEGGASAPFYEEYFSGGNGGFNDMVVDLGQEFPQGTVLYWYVYARTSTQNWDGEAYFETQQACDGLHKQAQRCIAGNLAAFSKVIAAQNKFQKKCATDIMKNREQPGCLELDPANASPSLRKARAKLYASYDAPACQVEPLAAFGVGDPSGAAETAVDATRYILQGLLMPSPEAYLDAAQPELARCKAEIVKQGQKLETAYLGAFAKAVKKSLTARNASELRSMVPALVENDAKYQRARAGVAKALAKACPDAFFANSGLDCSGQDAPGVAHCLDLRNAQQTCSAVWQAIGVAESCL